MAEQCSGHKSCEVNLKHNVKATEFIRCDKVEVFWEGHKILKKSHNVMSKPRGGFLQI